MLQYIFFRIPFFFPSVRTMARINGEQKDMQNQFEKTKLAVQGNMGLK